MTPTLLTEQRVWDALQEVMDPEIPVISLVELGVIRAVAVDDGHVTVTMTPTFSGCPALVEMRTLIHDKVLALGADSAEIHTTYAPPWTSDWISDDGRRKLQQFGLAPPRRHGGNLVMTFFDVVECPYCGSRDTTLRNAFGSTLCRAIYFCNSCRDAFEQFKPL